MLPDFPAVKRKFDTLFIRHLKGEINRRAPLLAQIRRGRQHEGASWDFKGLDGHSDGGEYEKIEAAFELTREEMKQETLDGVLKKVGDLAEQFARAQSEAMFAKVTEAAEGVGNVVNAGGNFEKEHFLEMARRVQTDFDRVTQEPRNLSVVLHPDTWARIKDDVKTWEDDPKFVAALKEIEEQQRIAWRDRESRQRLVD